jgi:GDP-4-dehydro-6-deoxy-D-mannose reductase
VLAELGGDALPLEADICDAESVEKALAAACPRAIVHLAGVSSVAGSWRDSTEAWRVNALGTAVLLQAVRRAAPDARILAVSTGEVYGRAEVVPTPEDSPLAPRSPYAASKAAAEIASEQERATGGLDVVVARAFQHEGPGRDGRFAVGSWTQQVAELERAGGGTLRVGDLSARRDITDVRDVARAYGALLDPGVPAGTYNVASGRAVSMREVLDLLLGLARSPIEVEEDPERLRPVDLPVVCGDPSRLREATGWEPAIPLEETLAAALDYARSVVVRESVSGP